MPMFRKKPVVIEAWPVREILRLARESWNELPESIRAAYESGDFIFGSDFIQVKTLEGSMTGGLSDALIRGVQGELYPCKKDIFEATYEFVDAAETK